MHILRPQFAMEREQALEFAAARGFGLFAGAKAGAQADVQASAQAGGIAGSHVPFTVRRTNGTTFVDLHLSAANTLADLVDGTRSFLLAIWGPDAYVSNDWYATPDHVSTWLYEAVHISGVARKVPRHENRLHGDRLLSTFEGRLAPKPPWALEGMDPDKRETMLNAIVVVEMLVERVEGQRKLNQHKSEADYAAVVSRLLQSNDPHAREVATRMMRLRPSLPYALPTREDEA